MNSEQFETFKSTINGLKSTHIKVDKIEFDNETGTVTLEIIQMPRGLKFTIDDMLEANFCFNKAEGMIKNDAIKDVVSWIRENKNFEHPDIKQFTLLIESGIQDNVIMMNHKTFLDFRDATEKYH